MKVSGKHPNGSSKPPFYKKISILEGLISMFKGTSDAKTESTQNFHAISLWKIAIQGAKCKGYLKMINRGYFDIKNNIIDMESWFSENDCATDVIRKATKCIIEKYIRNMVKLHKYS